MVSIQLFLACKIFKYKKQPRTLFTKIHDCLLLLAFILVKDFIASKSSILIVLNIKSNLSSSDIGFFTSAITVSSSPLIH